VRQHRPQFRDDGPLSAGMVAEKYSEFALRVAGLT
jgi:hypothetical protein